MDANPKLYLMQDGTYADPKDCSKGEDGVLRNASGVSVALGGDGKPMTLGEATATNAQAASAGTDVGEAKVLTTDDVKAKPAVGGKPSAEAAKAGETDETKAD